MFLRARCFCNTTSFLEEGISMRTVTALLAILLTFGVAYAGDNVKGYVKKDGTYVAPHIKSSPNDTKFDNYSTKGNVNPYTGKAGTVDPYKIEAPRGKTYNNGSKK
jgi:hypothetical protein